MHCVGCWAGEYGHKNNLSFEDMDKIITEGKELGVYLYMLTGGEPLVRKGVNQLVAGLKAIPRHPQSHHDHKRHPAGAAAARPAGGRP